MTRMEMIRRWRWLVAQGDYEAAKEVAYDFFNLWEESIFDYV